MKICPRCQKTYADDNLNFCLEDGSVLSVYAAASDQPTVAVNQPRATQPQQPQTQPQPQWNVPQPPQAYSMQPPKKSSKAWVWVLLILGGVILLCGGGGIAFVFYIASQQQNMPAVANVNARSTSTTRGTNTTASTSDRDDLSEIDLSGWVQEFSIYGITQFTDGEFIMSSKNKGFYYVLVGKDENQTDDADTRVTVRNIDNADSRLGYGLVFHSNPQPLQQDYAFLIDTKRKKYRVVRHAPQKETSVVNWTSSNAIKEGAAENVLEARDMADKIELYINGTLVSSIKNTHGYAGGVAGLYSGDGARIGFKDLEIRK